MLSNNHAIRRRGITLVLVGFGGLGAWTSITLLNPADLLVGPVPHG